MNFDGILLLLRTSGNQLESVCAAISWGDLDVELDFPRDRKSLPYLRLGNFGSFLLIGDPFCQGQTTLGQVQMNSWQYPVFLPYFFEQFGQRPIVQ
jgi:hypothetical protein